MKPLDPEVAQRLELVHQAAASKLAKEPVALDVRDVTVMTDVIYVCHGDSGRAVDAIADAILDRLSKAKQRAAHVEGQGGQNWVLIDLGPIMVHVFARERRSYYGLEKLWHDAPRVELPAA